MSWQWLPHPETSESWNCDLLYNHEGICVATLEDFGYACYPSAINVATGNLERGGPYSDRVGAMQWAERVAGMHPTLPNDKRPPFYYRESE